MHNRNSDMLTLALSCRLALVDGRNAQASMIKTARIIRARTTCKETYECLGMFITMAPNARLFVIGETERMAGIK